MTKVQDPNLVRAVFNDVRLAPFWLVLRVVLGWFWLQAGWHWLQDARGLVAHPSRAVSAPWVIRGQLA